MAKKGDNTLLIVGAAAAALYFLLPKSGSGASSSLLPGASTALLPSAPAVPSQPAYPYLMPGAPAIPQAYDDSYYKTYIRPAMLQQNSNVNNPNYILSGADQTNYLNNYLDLRQGLPSWVGKHFDDFGTVMDIGGAAQRHWHVYGVAEQRTFLPLPWSQMKQYVPPPPNSNSGSSVFGTILKVATIAAGGVLTVVSAGTAAPLIAAGTSAVLTAEQAAIHGPEDKLNDSEIELLVTSAAVIKKILPFYLQVNPQLVNSIENRLDTLIAQYAN